MCHIREHDGGTRRQSERKKKKDQAFFSPSKERNLGEEKRVTSEGELVVFLSGMAPLFSAMLALVVAAALSPASSLSFLSRSFGHAQSDHSKCALVPGPCDAHFAGAGLYVYVKERLYSRQMGSVSLAVCA